MNDSPSNRRLRSVATLAQWVVLGALVGLLCGSGSALFLWSLDQATDVRERREWLVWLLPIAGLGMGWILERFGKPIEAGQNLVIDTIHDGGSKLPLRMAPMVLIGTVLTHLFGGSAGREGTAVQMGASLADEVWHRLRLPLPLRRTLLAAGVAAGFGSVFGTPIAGALFGLEFVILGRVQYTALLPALVASLVGDWTTRAWGIVHTAYPIAPSLEMTPGLLGKWMLFAIVVAAATVVFIESTHFLKKSAARWLPSLPIRMFIGGAIVVFFWQLFASSAYLGLGLPTIVRAFTDPQLPSYAFAAKLLFTAVTLSVGFVGGEVTPLFFIGATLGNLLGQMFALPLPLAAGVGLAAVFAAASNTPLAMTVMAAELFGASILPHAAIVCMVAYLLTGRRSIYPAQRLLATKGTPGESSDPAASPEGSGDRRAHP